MVMTDFSSHPVISDRMARLRCRECAPSDFRRYVHEIASLLVFFATKHFRVKEVEVQTPLTRTSGKVLNHPVVLVPILRAGLGLSESFQKLLPEATVAHLGMARNEQTLKPEIYLQKLPGDLEKAEIILLDPMLATGGSALAAIEVLKNQGAQRISFVCLVASPEGLGLLREKHPDVLVTCAVCDEGLNENGFIVPGLGDAGDRIFGTT